MRHKGRCACDALDSHGPDASPRQLHARPFDLSRSITLFSSVILAAALLAGQAETEGPASPADSPPKANQAAEGSSKAGSTLSSGELQQAVLRLVRQLNDAQLTKRDAAEKELTALGPSALEYLPQITARTPAEVKDRLGRIRRALENAAVELASRPAVVSLEGPMSLEAALKSLQAQSGNRVVDFRGRFDQQQTPIQVNMNVSKVTFWQALDTLLDQARMTIYNYGGESAALTIISRPSEETSRSGKAAYAGQFRFEAVRLDASRDLRNPANNSLQLALDIAWEPRLRPIVITIPLRDLKILGDEAAPLELDEDGGEPEVTPMANVSATELIIPLKLPSRSLKTLRSIRGRMDVLAQAIVETFEFAELERLKESEQKRAGVSVVFEQMRKNQDVFEIRIRVVYDAASNALESHRGWILDNPAYLIDPAGNVVENAGVEVTRQQSDEIGLSYKFVVDGGFKGYKFVYKTAAALTKLPVEFEIKDVELP